jgi:hypothetical protein
MDRFTTIPPFFLNVELFAKEHLIQKGPAFEHPMEVMVDGSSGQVTVRYTEDGKAKTSNEHLAFTPNTANGMILTLLKNIPPDTPETKLPFVIATLAYHALNRINTT